MNASDDNSVEDPDLGDEPPGEELDIAALFEGQLIYNQFFDGLFRQLIARCGPPASDIEDAVATAVAKTLRPGAGLKITTLNELRGYLWRVAEREVVRTRRKALARHEVNDDNPHQKVLGGRDSDPYPVQEAFYRWLIEVVQRWPTETQRTAALLMLEAAWDNEPMTGVELAEAMSADLDRDISPPDARRHWERAAARLEREVHIHIDLIEEDEDEGN